MPSELGTGFLVAAPSLVDPNFKGSVILLVQHQDEGGSLGFIVNRPARISFPEIAKELGFLEQGQAVPDLPVLEGGPVAPHTGWLVFDRTGLEPPEENILTVTDRLCVSTSLELLGSFAKAAQAPRRILVLGYAGWGPGQLAEEIREGAWIPVDLDERILFETPAAERWNRALSSVGIDPLFLVGARPAEA